MHNLSLIERILTMKVFSCQRIKVQVQEELQVQLNVKVIVKFVIHLSYKSSLPKQNFHHKKFNYYFIPFIFLVVDCSRMIMSSAYKNLLALLTLLHAHHPSHIRAPNSHLSHNSNPFLSTAFFSFIPHFQLICSPECIDQERSECSVCLRSQLEATIAIQLHLFFLSACDVIDLFDSVSSSDLISRFFLRK